MLSDLEETLLDDGVEICESLLTLELVDFDELFENKLDSELLLEDIEDLALAGNGIWAWDIKIYKIIHVMITLWKK